MFPQNTIKCQYFLPNFHKFWVNMRKYLKQHLRKIWIKLLQTLFNHILLDTTKKGTASPLHSVQCTVCVLIIHEYISTSNLFQMNTWAKLEIGTIALYWNKHIWLKLVVLFFQLKIRYVTLKRSFQLIFKEDYKHFTGEKNITRNLQFYYVYVTYLPLLPFLFSFKCAEKQWSGSEEIAPEPDQLEKKNRIRP